DPQAILAFADTGDFRLDRVGAELVLAAGFACLGSGAGCAARTGGHFCRSGAYCLDAAVLPKSARRKGFRFSRNLRPESAPDSGIAALGGRFRYRPLGIAPGTWAGLDLADSIGVAAARRGTNCRGRLTRLFPYSPAGTLSAGCRVAGCR